MLNSTSYFIGSVDYYLNIATSLVATAINSEYLNLSGSNIDIQNIIITYEDGDFIYINVSDLSTLNITNCNIQCASDSLFYFIFFFLTCKNTIDCFAYLVGNCELVIKGLFVYLYFFPYFCFRFQIL
jgi:hypothetical protein